MRKDIIVYVDLDGVMCNYNSAMEEALSIKPEIVYPQSIYGFFMNLQPIEGAVEGYKYLHDNFDTQILTAPSYNNPLCYTEKRVWVEKYLGLNVAKKMIIAPNKSLFKGHYLIDDIGNGKAMQHLFEGTLLLFGGKEYPNWDAVVNYFKKHY